MFFFFFDFLEDFYELELIIIMSRMNETLIHERKIKVIRKGIKSHSLIFTCFSDVFSEHEKYRLSRNLTSVNCNYDRKDNCAG